MEVPNLSIDHLTQAALALPIQERATLAARIVESIDSASPEISPAWLDLAERRRQEVLAGTARTLDADQVSERVRRHIQ